MEDHLTTFAVGACLCVPSEEDRLSLRNLASFASKSGADWAHLTPSFAELLTPALMPTMKTMLLGGEAMTAKNIRNWAASPDSELIQVYRPSECCVTSTISPAMSFDSDPTNIGSAVPGCKTWVVRSEDPNALQAIGVVGELLMEGPILAKEYLNSPEQTTNSFIQGLRWAPEKRLYKTGDLVKYDSSGHLHFAHRRDGQVKLRGQRIELGEIERQMALDPRVQHCLALVPGSGPCATRLTAVIVLNGQFADASSDMSTSGSTIELLSTPWLEHISGMRDHLLDRLPPYMNPELWIILKLMPRNSSGKLDRKTVTSYLENLTPEEFADILPRMEEDRSLLQAHPMLRARFERHDDKWTQRVPSTSVDEANDCRVRFHSRDEHNYALECIAEARLSIPLTKGPLVALDVFETARQTLMSVTIHHLVVDTVSWRILFRELEEFEIRPRFTVGRHQRRSVV